jgi:hypothetical protein
MPASASGGMFFSTSGVRMKPGPTQLTRMLCAAYSSAAF